MAHSREPNDLTLGEHLDQYELMPESSQVQKDDLLLLPKRVRHQCGPYFFFQVLNHRSPEGESEFLFTRLHEAERQDKLPLFSLICRLRLLCR